MTDRDLDANVAEAMGWQRRAPRRCENPKVDEGGQGYARCNACHWTGNWADIDDHLDSRSTEPSAYSSYLPAALTFARHVLTLPECTGFVLEHDSGGWFVRFYGTTKDFTQMIGPDGSDERIARAICLCGLELLEELTPRGARPTPTP